MFVIIIVVEVGYYDQESLEEMFGSYLTFTEDGYAHPSGPAYDLVFQQAPDLSRYWDLIRFRQMVWKEENQWIYQVDWNVFESTVIW